MVRQHRHEGALDIARGGHGDNRIRGRLREGVTSVGRLRKPNATSFRRRVRLRGVRPEIASDQVNITLPRSGEVIDGDPRLVEEVRVGNAGHCVDYRDGRTVVERRASVVGAENVDARLEELRLVNGVDQRREIYTPAVRSRRAVIREHGIADVAISRQGAHVSKSEAAVGRAGISGEVVDVVRWYGGA